MVAAVALLPCSCRGRVACISCRARILKTEIVARGIRIHRWRNDSGNVPRRVSHVAGPVDIEREPRRSCPGYIVDRTQVCIDCGEILASGKWALFFSYGIAVTKLCLRDGSQEFAQPSRAEDDSISCAELARIRTRPRTGYIAGVNCGMIGDMDQGKHGGKGSSRLPSGRIPYGWTRTKGVVSVVLEEHAVRSSIVLLRQQGLSYRRIAAILNEAGYATNDGARVWNAMGVQRIAVRPLPQWLVDYLQSAPVVIELVVPASFVSHAKNGGNSDEKDNNSFEFVVA